MFDFATRPLPDSLIASTGMVMDWRLVQPGAAQSYPWTDFTDPSGTPLVYVDVMEVHALELEPTLQTAIMISLFTDRRAGPDDVLPPGTKDRRGWVGEEFVSPGQAWGSHLWLYYATKTTAELPALAELTCREALQWMLDTGLAQRVQVTAAWRGDVLTVQPVIWEPDNPEPVYDVLWATSILRGAA